jgi:autotransporter-associated beta strand protein
MKSRYALAALAVLALASPTLRAASMSASASEPVIDGEDIANYGDVSGTDKWWTGTSSDSAAKGQTFTTGGSAVRLKSISYQISEDQKAEPNKTYAIRVGEVAGTNFSAVRSETATQNFTWNAGEFMTWTFDTPVLLEPYTTYGIDVGLLTSTSTWQTGIPYINVTGDDYYGGAQYSSGASGTGTSTLSYSIALDRIFHLDIERPLGPVFELAATYPVDDATGVLTSRNLVLTFSQNVSPGTGNLTIRNLTDSIDVMLPANDPRLTYDQNVVRIDPDGLLTWNKNYAIRIDAGTILGDGGTPVTAISDDTIWNFSTAAGDPLLDAIAALKNHITAAVTLTGAQIAAHKTTIDNHRQRFAENTTNISAVFDLISTYDTAKGPLFVSGSTVTDFSRNNTDPASIKSVSPQNIHWVVYTVMQHAMDIIYTAETLADTAKRGLIVNFNGNGGYKFGSHTSFPGPCAAPAAPSVGHTVQINGSFPITFGRATQQWTSPARKPTGTYLAPGTIATVTVSPALVNAGYKVRVGAHSWDLSGRTPVQRLERATRLYPLDSETIEVASPYGGGIYIEVPIGADAGVVSVTVTGAVRAPYFSAKSFHQTTPAEWNVERSHPAPWADFQSDKFMMQVPRTWIYNHPDPAQTMADWDAAMDAINSLMGFPTDRGKETMYCQVDVIMRSSVHAPGYPAVNVTGNPNTNTYAGYRNQYLVRGPGASPTASHIEFHEQGHAYFFPKFGGESESNVNLLQPAMLHRKFGYSLDVAHAASLGSSSAARTLDNTAIAWMCVFNFSPRNKPMADGEKAYQHKGHAKFLDIVRLFGWEGLDTYWRSFMEDDAAGISYPNANDDKLLRLSRSVGKDIRPLFHFWGIHPQNPSALAAAIAAENIPASPEIRNLLLHYKSLVPADNTAFRSFAQAWWGKKPSIGGYWEEREHSRQWDQEALYGAGDHQRADITINEEYIEACAAQVRDQVQELIDLYYPSAITPNPMAFAVAPSAMNANTVGMSALTANAAVGPIQYQFENTANSTSSGWIISSSWQQNGLATDQSYTYRVKARDGLANETDWSAPVTIELTAAGDITPPAPDPMTFATPPYAVDEETITMTATTAFDLNGVEYYFECVSGGGQDSGWQQSPSYTDGNLQPLTSYGYRVRTRDGAGNLSGWSATATANTSDIPDVTPPQIVSLFPANDTLVSDLATNLVITFDEAVIIGNGSVTLKNLTDGTQSQISVTDPAVSVSGNTVTINPPTDFTAGKTYAIRIDDNAVADVFNNPFIGINNDTSWTFEAILEDPVADAGGPYGVPFGQSLSLDGSGSMPSYGEAITSYEWDLNNDNTFGDVSGQTPASIGDADLAGVWGMIPGPNTIQLRITDSAGKISTTSTVVRLGITLTWDANGTTAGLTDGGGAWLDDNKWRDDNGNTNWTPGAAAIFGNSGAGGLVTLASPTTVGSLTFNSFTGTYTLGSTANAITLNGGITKNAGSDIATFASPLILGGPQTWTNEGGSLTTADNATIDNGGHNLTIDGTGLTSLQRGTISGTGGIIKNGAGRFILGGNPAASHTFSGNLVLNGGITLMGGTDKIGTGNLTLNGGVLEFYWSYTLTRTLGSGPGQVQVLGGASGFSENGSTGGTVRFNNSSSYEVVWGSPFFKPSTLILQAATAQNNSSLTFDNPINLNGETRTIFSAPTTGTGAGSATLARVVRNTAATPAGLIKTGGGRLNLNAANTYDGGTTLEAGTLQLGNTTALGSSSGPLTVNGGLLNINNQTVSIGNLTGSGGTIANNGNAARTLTIGNGNGSGGIYQGVISNNTNAGTGSLAVTKTGSGTITLAGENTYTGTTAIHSGTLVITGATQSTGAITFADGGVLGFTLTSPVSASNANVDLSGGAIQVIGSPTEPSHTLLTAASITGTPVLVEPIPGYELQIVGNQLQLNQSAAADPYTVWSDGAAFDADANNDGLPNGIAWLLGAANKDAPALTLMPEATKISNGLVLTFDCLPGDQRGGAVLSLHHSTKLGSTGPWTSVPVPGTVGNSTAGGVDFVATANGNLIRIVATIHTNEDAPGMHFARLMGAYP